jgi:hypothetical protein
MARRTRPPEAEPVPTPTPAVLHHFRWDLDKTYLQTDFDTTRDLVRTWFQSAEQKRGIPGAATLLRELLLPADDGIARRVTFVSGSPRQMRTVLTRKLHLDGIRPDQFILKPNLSNLLLFRFKAMRSQVGYKVDALLRSRLRGDAVEETLFGDDAEQDALVYCLYADLISGAVGPAQLSDILRAADTDPREAARIEALVGQLEPAPTTRVRRIFINLERRSPVSRFDAFGDRVSPIYNYFQAAVLLHQDGSLSDAALVRMTVAMQSEGYTPTRLTNSSRDLIQRGLLQPSHAAVLSRLLQERAGEAGAEGWSFAHATGQGLETLWTAQNLAGERSSTVEYLRACAELRKYRREKLAFPVLRLLE